MPAKRNIMPEEVRNAKLLLSKGLSDAEVAAIIGRSVSAVINIRNGAYDFMLADVPNDTPDDSRVCILLKSIDSRLYQQNEDMKKAIDQLVVLNSALVELQNEIKVCSSCIPLSPTAEDVSQKRFKALSAGQLKVHGSQTRSMCSSWQAIR